MKPPIENIELIRKARNLSREEMAKKLNVTLSSYGKIERGETSITLDRLFELAEIFQLQPEEILTYNKPKKGNVIYIPVEAQAGFFSEHSQNRTENYTVYFMPFIGSANSALYMINATGDSMLPTINPGDSIVIEEVKERSSIKYGKPYVVVSSDGLVIKRIHSSQDDKKVILKSDNTIYEPYEILKKDILSIWLLRGCFDQSLTPKNPFAFAERFNQQYYKNIQS